MTDNANTANADAQQAHYRKKIRKLEEKLDRVKAERTLLQEQIADRAALTERQRVFRAGLNTESKVRVNDLGFVLRRKGKKGGFYTFEDLPPFTPILVKELNEARMFPEPQLARDYHKTFFDNAQEIEVQVVESETFFEDPLKS
jgi:hypothetical protein